MLDVGPRACIGEETRALEDVPVELMDAARVRFIADAEVSFEPESVLCLLRDISAISAGYCQNMFSLTPC